MPAPLLARQYLGLSLAQWILWTASLAVPFVLFWMLTAIVGAIATRRIADSTNRAVFQASWKGVRWLLVAGLTLGAHLAATRVLGFSLTFRVAYTRVGLGVLILIAMLLVWRLVSVTFRKGRRMAMSHGHADTSSLMLLGERVAKVVVVIIAAKPRPEKMVSSRGNGPL